MYEGECLIAGLGQYPSVCPFDGNLAPEPAVVGREGLRPGDVFAGVASSAILLPAGSATISAAAGSDGVDDGSRPWLLWHEACGGEGGLRPSAVCVAPGSPGAGYLGIRSPSSPANFCERIVRSGDDGG